MYLHFALCYYLSQTKYNLYMLNSVRKFKSQMISTCENTLN